MKEISIKNYIRYIFGWAILVFFLNKFLLRPWVLENSTSEFLKIVVLSIPNLIEAVVGTLLLTGIIFQLKYHFNKNMRRVKDLYIYSIAVGLTSIYSISQEIKLHNLGGNNVYDPYDVIASLIGLIMTFILIQTFGFVQKGNGE